MWRLLANYVWIESFNPSLIEGYAVDTLIKGERWKEVELFVTQ